MLRFILIIAAFLSQDAFAANATLKKVQITDGTRVDLLFDQKISPKQIRTEFFGDIIQVSLTDVSVYPAKINSVSGADLTKVFAYQYAPKLTRCRLSVKGTAEAFKDRFEIKAEGKVLSLRINGDAVVTEEKALLDRVMQGTPVNQPKVEAPAAAAEAAPKEEAKETSKPNQPIAGGKPLPSPMKSFLMLGVVMFAFLAIAWGIKRFRSGSNAGIQQHKGIGKILAQFGPSKNKMIEVVANHYLGPKKSISVVRIGGRTMVLGVTNESINLITQLSESNSEQQNDSALSTNFDFESLAMESAGIPAPQVTARYSQGSGATSAGPAKPAAFAQMLGQEAAKPSVRSQIRSRMEGMKQL